MELGDSDKGDKKFSLLEEVAEVSTVGTCVEVMTIVVGGKDDSGNVCRVGHKTSAVVNKS